MRTNKRTVPEAEIVPQTILAPLELASIFGRVAPAEVDLGCGDGNFLCALAAQNPAGDFVGVDKLIGRVRTASRKIGAGKLHNARVLRAEIMDAIQQLFPRESVTVYHLMFPDPWPKRRHHNRRVVTEEFLRAVARSLVDGGELRMATDQAEYFAEMQRVVARVPLFRAIEPPAGALPASTFEARFRASGAPIYRLSLRKTSGVR